MSSLQRNLVLVHLFSFSVEMVQIDLCSANQTLQINSESTDPWNGQPLYNELQFPGMTVNKV